MIGDSTPLQDVLTRLYALLGSMDSYDHFGHGFHFFDPTVMGKMERERLALLAQVNTLIPAWRQDDPDRLDRWIIHNESVLRAAIARLSAQPNQTSDYHIKRCNDLLAQWTSQRDRDELVIRLETYWGLGVEGF